MLPLAFSTAACPNYTLRRAAETALDCGFSAIDLHSRGEGAAGSACDPALTDPAKVRSVLGETGAQIASLSSETKFDTPVLPPLLGLLLDNEAEVREAARHVDTARAIGAPVVRVFALAPAHGEPRRRAVRRIAERLARVCDHARDGCVRVALENAGGFPRAADIAEIIDRVNHPLMGASYALAPAAGAGESPEEGVAILVGKLFSARVSDERRGEPAPLSEGDLPGEAFVGALESAGYDGCLVYDHRPAAGEADGALDAALGAAAETLTRWSGARARKLATTAA